MVGVGTGCGIDSVNCVLEKWCILLLIKGFAFFKEQLYSIYFFYLYIMSTILIKADNKSNKILSELAKQLGGNALTINDDQFDDLMLGMQMVKVKTGKTVSKKTILNKLKSKWFLILRFFLRNQLKN